MTISLRPFLPSDAPALARLFRASVEVLAEEDYSVNQRAAWAGVADELVTFTQRLAGALTLIATRDGGLAGFASFVDGRIDMLYVDPEHARAGVASALADALEKLAAARGATEIQADASDAARDFFAARGYAAWRRNTVTLNGEWLATTTMKKQFAQPDKAGALH